MCDVTALYTRSSALHKRSSQRVEKYGLSGQHRPAEAHHPSQRAAEGTALYPARHAVAPHRAGSDRH